MTAEKKRYIIRQRSSQPGEKLFTNDLEEAVKIAIEKARNAKMPFIIFDKNNKEIAGIVKPNGEIRRDADTVLGRSQNQAVNSGTIKIDKDALQEMIRQAVTNKLGNAVVETKNFKKDGTSQETKPTRKITKSQLREAVQKATRLALMMESPDLGIGAYASKVDKMVEETIEAIDKLVESGEELMKENPTHDYAVQERNHLVQARIGILKSLKTQLVRITEDLYKKV